MGISPNENVLILLVFQRAVNTWVRKKQEEAGPGEKPAFGWVSTLISSEQIYGNQGKKNLSRVTEAKFHPLRM